MMKKLFFYSMLVSGTLLIYSCGGDQQAKETEATSEIAIGKIDGQAFIEDEVSQKNILQIAAASEVHSTLVKAVQATGLENVLANNGPLTVFAPTNEAFSKLPEGVLDKLLQPANRDELANIITFHAAPGTYTEEMLKNGMKLFQATGDYVDIEKKNGATFVNGAKILGSVTASNGIIHVVDAVMLPPE